MSAVQTILTDAALWDLVSRGHPDAFESLYNRHWASLLDEAYRRLQIREDAEEIVQEIFIDLYIRKDTIVIEYSITAYLHRAVQFAVYKKIRSYIADRKYQQLAKLQLSRLPDPIIHAEYNDLASSLQKAISSLPQKCREVFLLSRERGLSHHEIARQTNISQSTVEKHISRAIKSLRKAILIFSVIFFFQL
jgi:RNA polymerase sigma-19 factor, ECF subfamily